MPTPASAQSRRDSTERPGNATDSITRRLSECIGSHKFDMWFGHTELCVDGDRLEVATDSAFVARWIDAHFADDLQRAATEELGGEARVKVSVKPELFGRGDDDDEPAPEPEPDARRDDGGTGRTRRNGAGRKPASARRHYRRLDEYIVGHSNRLAHSAACQLVDDEQAAMISPLFVHGECGVGKTHLLQGICRRFAEITGRSPRRALRHRRAVHQRVHRRDPCITPLDAFRRRAPRKLDLLAIDDVHFLSNKVRTQSEFLHTLDAIDLTGARIVLASDEHPRHIRRFSQALISRFLSGMVVRIDRPDHETRLQLIGRLTEARGLLLNEAARHQIATRCVGSIRELEGAITKLAAVHSLARNGQRHDANEEVGLVLVEQLFNDRTWRPAAPIRIGQVIEQVCDRVGIAADDVMGSGRHRRVVLARALVSYLGRELTTHSYPEIAQAMGRTYHSTVHTAAQRLRRQISRRPRTSHCRSAGRTR